MNASSDDVISSEKDRVARIISSRSAPGLPVRIGTTDVTIKVGGDQGDDAAVLGVSGPLDIVAASDYVRGPKFALYEVGLLTLFDLGYYLAVANLSDMAAMGATPLGLLAVVRYPPDMSDREFTEVLDGIGRAAADHDTVVLGGDTGAAERLILSGSAIGACPPNRAVTRGGARPGDRVWTTLPLGLAGAAVMHMTSDDPVGLSESDESALLAAWRRPRARTDLAKQIADVATSCIDVSDGLLVSLTEIATASRCGFRLDTVPVHPVVAHLSEVWGTDPIDTTVSASVDFALLFTTPEGTDPGIDDALLIGMVTAESGILYAGSEQPRPLGGVGWDHTTEPADIEAALRGKS